MRWTADTYLEHMNFKGNHPPFFAELFGPLKGLGEDWREQGATEEEISLTAFGFDYVPLHNIHINTGLMGGSNEILEDDDKVRITRDAYGRKQKLIKASATIPLPMDFPVADADDWKKNFRHRYEWSQNRIPDDWLKKAKTARDQDALLKFGIPGAFDEVRQLMGDEEACMVGYEDPNLLRDMLGVMADTACRAIEETAKYLRMDQVSVHEDMAGKSGPLWGPQQMEDFAVPYYKRIRETMDKVGIPIFEMDSDGDMTPILDHIVEGGINVLHPLEPTGQMDAIAVREKYGEKLAIKGGINKFALIKGPDAIQKEIERVVLPLKNEKGVVFGLDHRIPTGVTIQNYRSYVEMMREALDLPFQEAGWGRMAF